MAIFSLDDVPAALSTLGLPASGRVDAQDVQRRYRDLIRNVHPDRTGSTAEGNERAAKINAARDVVTEWIKRGRPGLDNLQRPQQPPPPPPPKSQGTHSPGKPVRPPGVTGRSWPKILLTLMIGGAIFTVLNSIPWAKIMFALTIGGAVVATIDKLNPAPATPPTHPPRQNPKLPSLIAGKFPENRVPDIDEILSRYPLTEPVTTVFVTMQKYNKKGDLIAIQLQRNEPSSERIIYTCRYLYDVDKLPDQIEKDYIYRPGTYCPDYKDVVFYKGKSPLFFGPTRSAGPPTKPDATNGL